MGRTSQYPDGYWRIEKPMPQEGRQGINPSTMKPGPQWGTCSAPAGIPSVAMYDIPETFDSSAFLGRELDSITFASHVVIFRLGEHAVISVQYGYAYRTSTGSPHVQELLPVTSTRVVALVGRRVASCHVERRRELTFEMEGGGYLRLLESSGPYESFIVDIGGTEMIV